MTDPEAYVVTAAYITVKVTDHNSGGRVIRGFYEGAVIRAEDIDPVSLAHHLDSELMAPVEVAAPAAPEPAKAEPKPKAKAS